MRGHHNVCLLNTLPRNIWGSSLSKQVFQPEENCKSPLSYWLWCREVNKINRVPEIQGKKRTLEHSPSFQSRQNLKRRLCHTTEPSQLSACHSCCVSGAHEQDPLNWEISAESQLAICSSFRHSASVPDSTQKHESLNSATKMYCFLIF